VGLQRLIEHEQTWHYQLERWMDGKPQPSSKLA
jgi:hypothetical protein